MPGLKEIRNRIASIQSTQQITSAMKMVSASKLRKAQSSIIRLRPFTQKFNQILSNLGSDIGNADDRKYCRERDMKNILIIPVTSNRGLCGSFNSNVIRTTNSLIQKSYLQQHKSGSLSLICIGRKAHDYFYKRKFNVIDNYSSIFDNLTYASAEKLAENLIDLYIYNKFDRIIIIYNRFKNAAMQELSVEQFLPLDLSIAALKPTTVKKKEEIAIDYIFEPSQKEILSNIIPNYLKIYFFRMLLDSNASEHGARMTAMHIATDNASEILKQLRLSYNKARQASITKELLEIVTGAEALKG